MNSISEVMCSMVEYYRGDARRINHFLKVYGYAKTIGEKENLDAQTQELLEVTAIVHDIGIKISEQKYNSSSGNYQQLEGPPIAQKLLSGLGYDNDFITRVCYIIAHHHTYTNINGIDYQILVEADFLVNIFEDAMSKEAIGNVKEKIFKTTTGIKFLEQLYGV
jgi:HD superfamily phosphodiesterase